MKSIWVVDDDHSIRFVLEKALAREGLPVRSFSNARDMLAALDDDSPQVLVSDIRMPGGSGLELLAKVKARLPALPVIIMTAYSDLDSAVSAFQGGAFEYLPKPFDLPRAVELIRRAQEESQREAGEQEAAAQVPEMLGQAPAMQDVFRAIGRLSQSNVTVMITGESGSGKELVARALHKHSPRGEGPFRHQHGGHPEGPAGKRTVRPRTRRLHRRAGVKARPLRAGRRRHALPRRDRRHAVRAADAAAARAVRRPVLPRRRP
jgi:two-component system nitrogen regulation response regulator GlnG